MNTKEKIMWLSYSQYPIFFSWIIKIRESSGMLLYFFQRDKKEGRALVNSFRGAPGVKNPKRRQRTVKMHFLKFALRATFFPPR